MIRRVFWILMQSLFRFSPRTCFGWQRFLFRCFGARIVRDVHIYNSATVYYPWALEVDDESAIREYAYIHNLRRVTIGARATISHQAHLCAGTHDHAKSDFPLLRPPIFIGDQSWVCGDAFVGPGVTVGEGAIVGAAAVVTRDIAPWMIAVGKPARAIKRRAAIE